MHHGYEGHQASLTAAPRPEFVLTAASALLH
jgi:hypothetical protein